MSGNVCLWNNTTGLSFAVSSDWLNLSNNCQGKKRQVKESEELLLIMLTYQSNTARRRKKKKNEKTREREKEDTYDQGDAQTCQCSSLCIYMATKTSTLV